MKLFYDQLWKKKKSPLAALREAQLFIHRHSELIKTLTVRGVILEERVDTEEDGEKQATAPARLWAAFMMSGIE